MWRKNQKIIIFSFLLFFFLVSFVFAQELEIKYPEISGPTPKTIEKTLFPEYVKYIFNFAVVAAGIIALSALTYGGIRYLTSAGESEKLKAAKSQILSAFFGIIILLGSYLILSIINPQLVFLQLPFLEKITFPISLSEPPLVPPVYENYLWRITEIANSVKQIVEDKEDGIKKTAQDIKSLTQNCDCQYTQPMCLCENYTDSEGCKSLYCYSGETTQPCPDNDEIKRKQRDIIASLFEILYYKNRAVDEREDFLLEIENLKKEISYYGYNIQAEKEYLEKIEGEYARKEQEKLIQNLEARKVRLLKLVNPANEEGLYQKLEKELNQLAGLIEKIATPTDRLSKLPDGIPGEEEGEEDIPGCLENIKDYCTGSCEGGCYDKKKCVPVECKGGNPCPTDEIDFELSEIESLAKRIKSISDKIIRIVKDIIPI